MEGPGNRRRREAQSVGRGELASDDARVAGADPTPPPPQPQVSKEEEDGQEEVRGEGEGEGGDGREEEEEPGVSGRAGGEDGDAPAATNGARSPLRDARALSSAECVCMDRCNFPAKVRVWMRYVLCRARVSMFQVCAHVREFRACPRPHQGLSCPSCCVAILCLVACSAEWEPCGGRCGLCRDGWLKTLATLRCSHSPGLPSEFAGWYQNSQGSPTQRRFSAKCFRIRLPPSRSSKNRNSNRSARDRTSPTPPTARRRRPRRQSHRGSKSSGS